MRALTYCSRFAFVRGDGSSQSALGCLLLGALGGVAFAFGLEVFLRTCTFLVFANALWLALRDRRAPFPIGPTFPRETRPAGYWVSTLLIGIGAVITLYALIDEIRAPGPS